MKSNTIFVCFLLTSGKSLATPPADDSISQKFQYLFLFIAGIVFVLFISLYIIYRHERLIKQKNIILGETLTALQKQHGATSAVSFSKTNGPVIERNRQKAEESKNLYEVLNGYVVEQQLYLNPHLSRDNLAQLIHLNKNHFAQMLQENSGFKLADYLNNLRLEHAISLLKENPDHTIQAIATDSGFNNMSTFYALFKQKLGMTPSQYKSAHCEVDSWESDYQDYII